MQQTKNDTLLVTLTNIKELNSLKDEEITKIVDTILNTLNLNSLRRNINNVCMAISTTDAKVADINDKIIDNTTKLKLINKLLNNQNFIIANIRVLRKKKNSQNKKENLIKFIDITIETLKTIKMYQPLKEKEEKTKTTNVEKNKPKTKK